MKPTRTRALALASLLTIPTLCSSVSTRSYAQPRGTAEREAGAEPIPTPRTESRVRLKRGEPAPFDGILLPVETLARLVAEVERAAARASAEIRAAEARARAEVEAARAAGAAATREERAKRAAAEEALARERRVYERALASPSIPWYKTPYVSLVGGLLLGAGACSAAAAAVSR